MSDYPMLISNKLHSFRNFLLQKYKKKCKPLTHVYHFHTLCCMIIIQPPFFRTKHFPLPA